MRKDIKDILERIESGLYEEQEELVAKFWLFNFKSSELEAVPEAELEEISQHIWNQLQPNIAKPVRKLYPWSRVIPIAAAILLVAFGFYFYYASQSLVPKDKIYIANDVQPGYNGATLTLADGRQVKLTELFNGTITQESGINITKSADGLLIYELNGDGAEEHSQNTLSTSNGETFQVQLPDGSNVWLNSASSLTYSTKLVQDGQRKVKLTGEAYFEVVKDNSRPFIVDVGQQKIKVLGTHFNIESYGNNTDIKTTLLEGSIKLSFEEENVIVKPEQQVKWDSNKFLIKKVDINEVTAWKNGYFRFSATPLIDVMKKIARWYDLEIDYTEVPTDVKIDAVIRRDNKLSSVLFAIEESAGIKLGLEGRRLIIKK